MKVLDAVVGIYCAMTLGASLVLAMAGYPQPTYSRVDTLFISYIGMRAMLARRRG